MAGEDYEKITKSRFNCEWVDEVPAFRSDGVGDLANHWLDLVAAGDGEIPYRRQIDPMFIRAALSRIFIYEHLDAGFICRLAGERISWNHDERLKDRWLSELLAPPAADMVSVFMNACLNVPALYRNYGILYTSTDMREVRGERVFLPLRADDGRLAFVIGVTDVDTIHDAPSRPERVFYRCRGSVYARDGDGAPPGREREKTRVRAGASGAYSRSMSRMVMWRS